jgi:hypothetical protein
MQFSRFLNVAAGAFLAASAIALAPGVATASSIYESGYTSKIKMTAGQKSKVQRINRAATARVNEIFRKYGIRRSAQPEMRKLMAASGELQSAARQERNELAKVFTPTQLQEYDAIMRQVEDRIVRAAK